MEHKCSAEGLSGSCATGCSSWQAMALLWCGCLLAASLLASPAVIMTSPRRFSGLIALNISKDPDIVSWSSTSSHRGTHLKLSCRNTSTSTNLFGEPHEGNYSKLYWDKTCKTPCQRYATLARHIPYYDLHSAQTGSLSDQVVLVTTHWRSHFTAEMLVHLRSLVVESFPRPVFLLHHCENTETKSRDVSRLPSWLQPLTFPYAANELTEFFPSEPTSLMTTTGQVHALAQDKPLSIAFYTDLPVLLFMKHNTQFDFAWIMEDDVRLIGDWDVLFGSSLAQAQAHLNRKKSTGSPDLITFDAVCIPTQSTWGWVSHSRKFNTTHWRHGMIMLRGYSRQLVGKVQQVFKEGYHAYVEQLALTVAEMFKLNLAVVEHPRYGEPTAIEPYACKRGFLPPGEVDSPARGSYFWTTNVASRLYNQWLKGNYCQRPVLLHPVKALDVVTGRVGHDGVICNDTSDCFDWLEVP